MGGIISRQKIRTEREVVVSISEDCFEGEERGVDFEDCFEGEERGVNIGKGGFLWQRVNMLANKGNESGNVDEHAGFFCVVVALVEEFVEVSERGLHVLKVVRVVVVDEVDHGQYENPHRGLVGTNVG